MRSIGKFNSWVDMEVDSEADRKVDGTLIRRSPGMMI